MTTQVIALPQQNVTNQSDCGGPRAAAVARGTNRMVKVSQYLVRPDDIPRYGLIRSKWLGDHRPASMLAVIPGLVRPDFLIKLRHMLQRLTTRKARKTDAPCPTKSIAINSCYLKINTASDLRYLRVRPAPGRRKVVNECTTFAHAEGEKGDIPQCVA